MYETRLRRSTRSSLGRTAPLSGYDLDKMDVNVVEFPSAEEALAIKYEKRFGQYYVVKELSKSPGFEHSVRVGDVLVHVGELSTVGMGDLNALQHYIYNQTKWPIGFDFRTPQTSEHVDLVTNEAPATKSSAASTAMTPSAAVFLPQIPSNRTTAPAVFYDGNQVDLTMDDDEDDDKEVVEVAPMKNKMKPQEQWLKGQIVRTRYGVGSVYKDSSPGEPLVVLLHWWREYQMADGPLKHPWAFLNLETEDVVDCSNETIVQYKAWYLSREEYARFQPGVYLNDTIIDIFLDRLVNQVIPVELRSRVHVLTSHFYSTLEKKKYEGVQRWTKGVDIFSKDFILVPINDAMHWSLAIICFPERLLKNAVPTTTTSSVEVNSPSSQEGSSTDIQSFESVSLSSSSSEPQSSSSLARTSSSSQADVEADSTQQEKPLATARPKRQAKKPKIEAEGCNNSKDSTGKAETVDDTPIPVILKLDSTKSKSFSGVNQQQFATLTLMNVHQLIAPRTSPNH